MTSSPDVIVIGAGVLGLCSAAELGQRGHAVTVIDPGGPNASSVAAGMLAPALECLSDASTPERAALLKRARDLWPDFAEVFGLPLHRDGVDWRGPDIPAAIARLAAMGFTARPTPAGLTSPDDWRVDVSAALSILARAPGVTVIRSHVSRLSAEARRWRVEAGDGGGYLGTAPVHAVAMQGQAEDLGEIRPQVAGALQQGGALRRRVVGKTLQRRREHAGGDGAGVGPAGVDHGDGMPALAQLRG